MKMIFVLIDEIDRFFKIDNYHSGLKGQKGMEGKTGRVGEPGSDGPRGPPGNIHQVLLWLSVLVIGEYDINFKI